jgi:hypothetical protein
MGVEALAGLGSIGRMLDFSSAAPSCFRVSSTPLMIARLEGGLQAVHHGQQALGELLQGVLAGGGASVWARLRAFSASATARIMVSRCCSILACASASSSSQRLFAAG